MRSTVLFFILLCFIKDEAYAQNKYTRFVEAKNISWAADFSDTFHFTQPNLSELLREQLLAGKIKVALVEDPQKMQPIVFETLPAVLNRMRPNADIAPANYRDSLLSSNAFDQQTKDLVEIKNIIYLEKGQLRSHAYAVSPKYIVQTSWGMVLGMSNLFTTALREKRSVSKSVRRKAIMVGSTTTRMLLNEQIGNPLKQLYAQNLLQAIWPYLDGKYYETFRLDSTKKIRKADINFDLIHVPVYSENGTISATAAPALGPESFSSIDISQTWFYNKEKNSIFSTISHLILNIRQEDAGGEFQKHKPLLKIVVK